MLTELQVPHETRIVSAHRTPDRLYDYARGAAERGLKVIIAGAGGAAHLPGMLAAVSILPVLGAILCAFLASPLSGRESDDYRIAGVLLVVGVVLWALTWMLNRALNARPTRIKDVDSLR